MASTFVGVDPFDAALSLTAAATFLVAGDAVAGVGFLATAVEGGRLTSDAKRKKTKQERCDIFTKND